MIRYTPLLLALITMALASTVISVEARAGDAPIVGVVLPLSGEHKALGEAAQEAIAWGLSITTLDLQLDIRDSGGKPDVAQAQVEELAALGAIAIIGPIGAIESAAAAERAAELSVPILVLSSNEGIEDSGATVFRLRVSPESQSRSLAELALGPLELQRAAVFYPQDTYGRNCTQAFVETFVAGGGEVRSIESYDPEESKPDEEAELLAGTRNRVSTSTKKKRPTTKTKRKRRPTLDFETLFIPDDGANVSRALAFLKLAGVPVGAANLQLLGTSMWATSGLAATEGMALGAYVIQVFDPAANEDVEFHVAAFAEEFGRQPTELDAQAHDGVLALSSALQRCVDVATADQQRRCVVQGLSSSAGVDGVAGRLSFSKTGAPQRQLLVFDVDRDGQIWPSY